MSRRPTAPTGWSYSSIGEVCTFGRGVSWKKSQERRLPTQDAVPVLRIPNVQKTLDLTRLMYIDGLSKAQQAKARVKRGWTLLVGSNGNPKRVGNCVYVDDPYDFLFASFLVSAKSADARRVDGAFLYRLLSSTSVQNDICQSLQGSTGLRNIDLWALKSLRALVPPLPEQRKIAAILSSVDDAAQKAREVLNQVQVVKQGLVQKLLTRGLPDLHTRFKETPIGRMPEDWDIRPLNDAVTKLATGRRYDRRSRRDNGRTTIIDQSENGFFGYHDEEPGVPASALCPVVTFANHTCAVRWNEQPFSVIQNVFPIHGSGGVNSRYLYHILGQAIAPSGYKGHWPQLMETWVPVPTEDEQIRICAIVDAVAHRAQTEEKLVVYLNDLKAALMSVLLTGELRVTPDPEPE